MLIPSISNLTYRPDIDGLRAIAVLAVVIFHASPLNLKGGFIGVDIFFVISGYLITSILLKDLHQGRFSVLDFYIRRANRIFPELILMLLTVFGLGWFALLPDEYAQLGKYMAAGAGFVANLALWRDLGYFDTASDLKPLLHLWSLGVEEQFYFVWPLALWLGFKRRWNLLTLTILVSLASYYASLRGVKTDPSATFYLPHTRFWELLVGAFVAVCHTPDIKNAQGSAQSWLKRLAASLDDVLHRLFYAAGTPKVAFNALRLAASVLGLGLIIVGLLKLTSASVFPGKNALWPTVGAGLLIAAGRGAWVNRVILSKKIMVWIGLISYPLYLWHWPLLSLARIIEQETPSRAIRLGAVGLSFVLAVLTFYALEKPLCRVTALGKKAAVLFVLLMLTAFLGWNVYKRDGYGFRDGVKIEYVYHTMQTGIDIYPKETNLFGQADVSLFQLDRPSSQKGIMLLADSHLHLLFSSFGRTLTDFNLKAIVGPGMIPFILTDTTGRVRLPVQNYRFSAEQMKNYDTVILTAYWALYGQTGSNLLERNMSLPMTYDGKSYEAGDFSWFEPALRQTLTHLTAMGKTVILTHDVPELPFQPKECMDNRPLRLSSKHVKDCTQSKEQALARQHVARTVFPKVLKDFPQVKLFDPFDTFCPNERCIWSENKVSYYLDGDHLSHEGSAVYATAFKAQFSELFAQ